jgi:hypothetical protein
MCLKELFAGDCALVVTNDAWYARKLQYHVQIVTVEWDSFVRNCTGMFDLLVKRHDMARCPPGRSKVCQKSAWQQPAKDYRLKPKYICRYSCYHRLREIQNANDLRRVVLDIWTGLGLHYIRSLYDSIPRRIRCVLRSRGQLSTHFR